ncbi:MAG: pyridoxal phosphate-dependent aminotransferase [Syntrophales bacterium]|nr:pyridoxal phosphate-dependent aminotransferase [Syntrophales bacterium]
MNLSKRIQSIKPSPTLAITMKANALRAKGRDVVGFGAGEPDFDTPAHIKEAAKKAIDEGFTRYTPVGGIDELKDAIIERLQIDYGLTYERSEICVSCGAKHTLYNLAQVLFDEGDEVIIPAPYWVSYIDIVNLAGAVPVILETSEETGFKVTTEALREAITEKTKAFILNSPSNPTGAAYEPEEVEALSEVFLENDILIISDDIYEKIVYDGFKFKSIASVDEELKKRTVIVNGVSKAYAMTGWRIGYAAGPKDIIDAVTKLQSQNTSNPNSIAQKASLAALKGDQTSVTEMVSQFEKRRNYIVDALNAISGFSCTVPRGAFYVFPDISRLFGKSCGDIRINTSSDFAAYLLDTVDVAVVPGIDFGSDRHIRLSYATSLEQIREGIRRIHEAVLRLQ